MDNYGKCAEGRTRTVLNEEPNIDAETSMKRRKFLGRMIYTLTSLLVGALGGSAGAYLLGRPEREGRKDWTDAGELPELSAGSPQEITFSRNRVDGWKVQNEKASAWVIVNDDRTLTAFSPLCTHLGCAYQWERTQNHFSCPCHGSVFSKTGSVIAGPAPRPLDRYLVKIEGSRLWLGPVQGSQSS
jgi:menaquinol-cytochrome c reductase iron-sulfur subunit